MLRAANLALRFLLEIAALAALTYWGFTVDAGWPARIALGLASPLAFAVIWGVLVSPKARITLAPPARFAVEALLFAVVVAALVAAGLPLLGALFALVAAVNRVLMQRWGQ